MCTLLKEKIHVILLSWSRVRDVMYCLCIHRSIKQRLKLRLHNGWRLNRALKSLVKIKKNHNSHYALIQCWYLAGKELIHYLCTDVEVPWKNWERKQEIQSFDFQLALCIGSSRIAVRWCNLIRLGFKGEYILIL